MNYEAGAELLMNGVRGFHGKFKKMYGQMSLRLDDDTYINTGDNKLLSGIKEDDFEVCDITTGYLGNIFEKRKDINAVIFGCAKDCVSVSNEYDALPVALEDLAHIAGASVNVVAEASPALILNAIKDAPVCFIKGVGVIAVGTNMKKAVAAMQIAAKSAEALVHGKMLGGVKPFEASMADNLKADFDARYVTSNQEEKVDYVGFDEETFAVRAEIIEAGKTLVKKDLTYGAWGNISVRRGEDRMLITPSSMDYFELGIEDIVDVDIDSIEHGKQRKPSTDAFLHATLYKNLPDCNAIVHTHSNAISVFAACEAGFSIPDPAMKQLIGDVKIIPYCIDDIVIDAANTLEVMNTTHAAIISHHGAVFYGPTLELTIQIAEAVEMMARNLLEYDKIEEADEDA